MSRTLRIIAPLLLVFCGVEAARVKARDQRVKSTDTEDVPAVVSDAIRKAKSNAQKAFQTAQTHENQVKEHTEAAAEAAEHKAKLEAEKEAAARDATQKAKETADAAKAAAQAAHAAISSKAEWAEAVDASQKAQSAYQNAIENHNQKVADVQAMIRKLKDELKNVEGEMTDAATKADQAAYAAEELRIAYEAAEGTRSAEVNEHKAAQVALADATNDEKEKSLLASIAGREAEAAQMALEDAVSDWNAAKQDVEHKRALRDLLWDLYDAIEDFYRASSDLVRAMRRSEDECPKEPHECLISDLAGGGRAKLEDVLLKWNSMVLDFTKIKELHPDVYGDIEVAEVELDANAMAQIKLTCDPDMKLENSLTPGEFDEKCGSGLWRALGLTKNRFLNVISQPKAKEEASQTTTTLTERQHHPKPGKGGKGGPSDVEHTTKNK